MYTKRWGAIGTAAILLSVLWSVSRRGETVLAAVIRATEGAPAVHGVGVGSRGTRMEAWWVDGMGSSLHVQTRSVEQLEVDDRKQEYTYQVRERRVPIPPDQLTAQDRAMNRHEHVVQEREVLVGKSASADPLKAMQQRESFTFTGILKQMERRHPPKEISDTLVKRDGRQLRRLTAREESQVFYVDPHTNRLVQIEDWGGVAADSEVMRITIDYPDPATVDRKLFQFTPPPGVPVKHLEPAPLPRHRALSKQEQVWMAQQQELNACLSHVQQLREALRRYANDHHGEWPENLTPALDPYVKDRTIFRCPRDHSSAATSYIYHRLTGTQAKEALDSMNNAPPRDPNHPVVGRIPLIECDHHPKVRWHIDELGVTAGTPRSEAGK
jgi:hypothetical protein